MCMNIPSLLPLIFCAASVATASCECDPDCECEPRYQCSRELLPAWLEEMKEACCKGDADTIKRLLAEGADPNEALPYDSLGEPVSLLYLAVSGQHTECVRVLLACPGIDVNRRSTLICATPLHLAVSCNNPEIVRLLLAAPGIDVNATDSWSMSGCRTPLHTAAALGHTECLRLLLAAPGSNPQARDRWGRTPLQLAEKSGHSACAELLHIAS